MWDRRLLARVPSKGKLKVRTFVQKVQNNAILTSIIEIPHFRRVITAYAQHKSFPSDLLCHKNACVHWHFVPVELSQHFPFAHVPKLNGRTFLYSCGSKKKYLLSLHSHVHWSHSMPTAHNCRIGSHHSVFECFASLKKRRWGLGICSPIAWACFLCIFSPEQSLTSLLCLRSFAQ